MNGYTALPRSTSVVSVLMLSLSGCATTGSQHLAITESQWLTAPEVVDVAQLPTFDLVANGPQAIHLGGAGQLPNLSDMVWRRSAEDRSFALLLRLPAWQQPYSIEISSRGIGTLTDPALFYPRIHFLDQNYQITRQSSAKDFKYRVGGDAGGHGLTAYVFVNAENRAERYLLISGEPRHTVDEVRSTLQSSGSAQVSVPVRGAMLTWFIPTGGSERPTSMRAAAGGTLQLQVQAYAPPKMGKPNGNSGQ